MCESQASKCLGRTSPSLLVHPLHLSMSGLQQGQMSLYSLLPTQPGQASCLRGSREVAPGVSLHCYRGPRIPLPSEPVLLKSRFLHNTALLKILQWLPVAS